MNFDLYGFGPALAAGALMTVKLALTALCLGLVLGLAGALAKTSPYKPLQWLGGPVLPPIMDFVGSVPASAVSAALADVGARAPSGN